MTRRLLLALQTLLLAAPLAAQGSAPPTPAGVHGYAALRWPIRQVAVQ